MSAAYLNEEVANIIGNKTTDRVMDRYIQHDWIHACLLKREIIWRSVIIEDILVLYDTTKEPLHWAYKVWLLKSYMTKKKEV